MQASQFSHWRCWKLTESSPCGQRLESARCSQSRASFLHGDLAEMLKDPLNSLKPQWEWPEKPHASKVMSSQEEWDKIVAAAYARGLMVGVEEDQVFTDAKGNEVLNGAAGVRKIKMVGREERTCQRFISNLIS